MSTSNQFKHFKFAAAFISTTNFSLEFWLISVKITPFIFCVFKSYIYMTKNYLQGVEMNENNFFSILTILQFECWVTRHNLSKVGKNTKTITVSNLKRLGVAFHCYTHHFPIKRTRLSKFWASVIVI